MRSRGLSLLASLFGAWALLVPAPATPADRPVAPAPRAGFDINATLERHWREKGVRPAAEADDVALFRRLALDLTGRVPTTKEAEAFAAEAKTAQARAEAEARAAKEQLAQFAEQQRRDRHASHISFCESAVKTGKLLPASQATAVAVLDQLAESAPVEFSEGGDSKKVAPAEWLKGLIDGAKPLVQFGEFAGGHASAGAGGSVKDLSDAEIDKRARAYARDKGVSYSEALRRVYGFSD